jgi:uncharacterized protein (TIGR02391 family)
MTWQSAGLSEKEVLSLPVDELGLRILRDVRDSHEWNEYNWYLKMQQQARFSDVALRRCAEAWGWLRAKGLVARTPGQSASEAIFVTRRGEQVLKEGPLVVRAAERLDVDLHPRLEAKVRRQFLLGEYELVAFAALKEVEVVVCDKASAPTSSIGVPLMRRAFHPETGPLRDAGADAGERRARMDLYAGAIGLFKNPSSHRPVNYDDPTQASEIILLADLLLRLVDPPSQATP